MPTCGHKASISAAAMRTSLTPSSLLDMEQAKFATYNTQDQYTRLSILPYDWFPQQQTSSQLQCVSDTVM